MTAAADLDRKMIAVVAKADQPELFNIVRTIFHAWTQDLTTDYTDTSDKKSNSSSVSIREISGSNEIELDSPPALFGQIEKFDLDVPFWNMVKATFGYEEENPTLKNFLLRLVLTTMPIIARVMCRSGSVGCSCPKLAGQTPSSVWLNGETAAAKERATTGFQRMQRRSSRLKIICRTWRSTNSPK